MDKISNFEENKQYEYFNEFGGFVENGKEYEILLEGANKPPAPWINVIANNNFGFQISESGAGYSWCTNSSENKITPWSNDPVCDHPSEIIYIKDELSGKSMTPTSLGQTNHGTYIVRHGFGYSKFHHDESDLTQNLLVFTPLEDPLKIWNLNLINKSKSYRTLTITYYVEWALGAQREVSSPYIVTDFNNEEEYLSARNVYNYNFNKYMAFMFSSEVIKGYTGNREEFLGRKGSVLNPEGLSQKLSSSTGACFDPCGAIQITVSMKPEETKNLLFALGESPNQSEITRLVKKYKDLNLVEKELDRVHKYWENLLGKIQVKTNDRAIDILANGWLLYQTISCRINARSAFYQSGGAFGYRDQLQDSLSLLYANSSVLRNQIKIAASRQFEEGDVQHWWHSPMGIGVRTRISDDLLWLPYATSYYIKGTEDYSILKEVIPYIVGPILKEDEREIMFTPEESELEDSIYNHCKKAILHTLLGEHGLPLMGGGDWNDGMNSVGIGGKGESVWLAWFFYKVISDFISLANHEGDVAFAYELEVKRGKLKKNLEEYAWDGEWYLRAFYDDGTPLGSKENKECFIDSISQSWSVISQCADKKRSLEAMKSAKKYLVKEKEGVSLLLYPPFDKTDKNPGYIKNYFPGIRENGGQYTHAAVWLAIASTMISDYSFAYTLFTMLNPIHSTSNKRNALVYEKEPYVMVADISLSAPYVGNGGWSWYTGSSGWMYQGLINHFLGIRKELGYLIIQPATPQSFGNFSVEYKDDDASYEIIVNSRSAGNLETKSLIVDGVKIDGDRIKLMSDGKKHTIIV
jgi:cellobiose phosphorylase